MLYQIKLSVFEGPYDLLLFLIRKGEIDIYDIPIARITREYLEYIAFMRSLDLEIAGEFIVVAATLMRIKARMLLPVYVDEDAEEIEDPRKELVQSLLEYQRIKDASEKMEMLEIERRKLFTRSGTEKNVPGFLPQEDYAMKATVYDLAVAFNAVIKKVGQEKFHYIEPEPLSIEEQMQEILQLLETKKRLSFQRYCMQIADRIIIVINFLAVLELVKRGLVRISQAQPFKDIYIYKLPGERA